MVPAIEPPYVMFRLFAHGLRFQVNYVNFSDAAPTDMGYGPGVVIEILKEIAEMLNLTYTVGCVYLSIYSDTQVINETQSYAQKENGTWNKAFSELVHKVGIAVLA